MVLSAGRGSPGQSAWIQVLNEEWVDSHRCHLGQTQEHQKEPKSDDHKPPNQTSSSSIGQALCKQTRQSVMEPKLIMDGVRQNNLPRGDQRAAKSYD